MSFIRCKDQSIHTNVIHLRWTRKIKNSITSKDEFESVLSKYGVVKDILFPIDKSFGFIEYESVECAELAYEGVDNKECPILNGNIIHCEWASRVKESKCVIEKESLSWCYEKNPTIPEIHINSYTYDFSEILNEIKISNVKNIVFQNEEEISSIPCFNECIKYFNSIYGTSFNYCAVHTLRADSDTSSSSSDSDNKNKNNYYYSGIISHSHFQPPYLIIAMTLFPVILISPSGSSIPLLLNNNDSMLLEGEVGYIWEYKSANISKSLQIENKETKINEIQFLELRNTNNGICVCKYLQYCDSQINSDRSSAKPTDEEINHVHNVYDNIAEHFNHTRYNTWPNVEKFLLDLEDGSLVCDVGCGNGKYMKVNKNIEIIGCDRSENLLEICRNKKCEVCYCDALLLPYQDNIFDSVICIALLHHLSTPNHRLRVIEEIIRILKVNGKCLLYAWAYEQKESKRTFESQDCYVPWNLQKCYSNTDTIKKELVEEKEDVVVLNRYCHVFHEGELEIYLEKFNNVKLVDHYYDHANWCILFEKCS